MNTLAMYLEFARVGFVNILAFRLRYYTGIITYLLNVTVYYYIWTAVLGAGQSEQSFEQVVHLVEFGAQAAGRLADALARQPEGTGPASGPAAIRWAPVSPGRRSAAPRRRAT